MLYIAPILLDWYALHGRDLPWRCTRDPYLIWLSEVILQQTRVAQGTAYYLRFAERFPDVAALAAASQDEVLKLWQGLGYYTRARNLHAAARQVVEHFGGVFPSAYDDLRSLKGVGEYTASAVSSAACDEPRAVVDGNVCRVLSRLFDLAEPIDTTVGRRAMEALAQSQCDVRQSGRYNQAIMDFGALQCTPVRPWCSECPFSGCCLALAANTVVLRPVKRARTAVSDRWFNYLHITCGKHTLLRRRNGMDIWQGLYEFPMIETPRACDFGELVASDAFSHWLGAAGWVLKGSVVMPPHKLSHRTIRAVFHRLEVMSLPSGSGHGAVVVSDPDDYALPRLIDRYLSRNQM